MSDQGILLTAADHNITQGINGGEYHIIADMSTGTIQMQAQGLNTNWVDIPDTTWSASTMANLKLSSCRIRAQITGDAELLIALIENL